MSFPRYERYKDSGVEWLGEVPEHWEIKKIRRVISASLINGIFKKKEEFGKGVLLVNVFDIYQDDFKIKPDHLDRVRCDANEINTYQVLSGDLFFVRSSLKQEGVAVVAVTGDHIEPVVFECHLIRARPDKKLLDARYGSYLLNSALYRYQLIARAKITTMTTIDQDAILSILLTTPPVPEQKIIATFLDRETTKIDELIAEQQRLVELLKEKRQAVISHAVTKGLNPVVPMKDSGVEWLGEVPEHWEIKKLKYLLKKNGLVRGPFGGHLKKEIFVTDGFKVYEQKNAIYKDYLLGDSYISDMKFKEMFRFIAYPNDYIMSCSGTVGKVFRIPEDAPIGIINQALLIIRFNETVSNRYSDWIFDADFFQNQILDNSQGGAMKNLVGMEVFTSIELTCPPIDEQINIATFLDRETTKIDELINEAKKAIELLKERRTALISAAVTGKIDLRGLVADKLAVK